MRYMTAQEYETYNETARRFKQAKQLRRELDQDKALIHSHLKKLRAAERDAALPPEVEVRQGAMTRVDRNYMTIQTAQKKIPRLKKTLSHILSRFKKNYEDFNVHKKWLELAGIVDSEGVLVTAPEAEDLRVDTNDPLPSDTEIIELNEQFNTPEVQNAH